MGDRLAPAAATRGSLWIFAALAAFALWVLPAPARAADTASGPDGTITLVAGLQYSRLAPDGTQSPWRDYAPRESEEEGGPVIALAPDGTATVVWIRSEAGDTAILERRIDPEGELEGGVNELGHSEDPHVYPEVAVAPDGTATAVWTATHEGETAVEGSRIAPDGTADPAPTELTTGASYQPQLGVAPDGTTTVVWQQFGEDKAVAEARQIAPDGSLGEALKLSSGAGSAQDPAVAVTSKGAAVVVWEDFYSSEGGSPDEVLEERRIEPDGKAEAAVHLLSAESGARAPVLAAGPDGSVTVLWSQSFNHLAERRVEADGAPAESIFDVSSPAVGGIYPQVAVEPNGKALVVWSDGWNIFFRRLGSDGTPLGDPTQILESSGYLNLFGLGLGPDGVATPIWQRRLGYYNNQYVWVTQGVRIQPDDSLGPIFNLTDDGTEAATPAAPAAGENGSAAGGSQGTAGQASPLLQLGKPKSTRHHSAAALPVTASRAGMLETFVDCSGSQDRSPASLRLEAGTETLVPVRASGPCRRTLRQEGAVKLKVTLRFAPDEGEPVQRSRQVLLQMRRGS